MDNNTPMKIYLIFFEDQAKRHLLQKTITKSPSC